MKRTFKLFSASMILILCVSISANITFAQNAKLILKTTHDRVELGNKIQIDVEVKEVNDLFGYELNLSYPFEMVEFDSVVEGNFLKNNKKQTIFEKTIDPQNGQILVSSALAGKSPGISGDGILFSVVFKTRFVGKVKFLLTKNNVWNSNLSLMPIQSGDVTIEIYKILDSPILSVEPSILDFGSVNFGEVPEKTFQISNKGKGSIEGEVASLTPWIRVTPQTFSDPTEIKVMVTTTLLTPNDSYSGEIKVRSNAGEVTVAVKIYIVQITKHDPPTLKILTPDPDMISRDKRLFILCETTPGAFASINNQNVAVDIEDGIFFMNIILREGKNQIPIAVWDAYENKKVETITATLDTTPPTLTVDGIPLFSFSDNLIITGKTEPDADLTFNSQALLVAKDGSFSVSYKAINTINQLIFTSRDALGNKRNAIRVFFYRPVLPNVIILTVGSSKASFNAREFDIDAPPVVSNGRVLVPLRVIAEIYGADVLWKPETKAVNISLVSTKILLTVGRTSALMNGKTVTLDTPPSVINGRVMVPIRFISEAFQSSVEWNQEEKNVIIRF